MNSDGSGNRRLAKDELVLAPRWTGDGKQVVYTDTRDWEFGPGHAEIRIIGADGRNLRVVTAEGGLNLTGGGFWLGFLIITG